MRIGFFSDRYLPLLDGIAYSIDDARKQLEAQGHEVYIFAPKPSLRYREPSPHVMRFNAVKGMFWEDYMSSLFFPPQVARQIEKLDLDLIHFHTPGQVGLFGAYFALKHNIPLVSTYHTDLYEYVRHYPAVLPGTIALSMLIPVITGGGMQDYRTALSSIRPERNVNAWNQKIVQRGLTMIHNQCDLIITPSIKMERQLKSWNTESEIVTLPSGVDPITTNPSEVEAVRAKYDLQPNDHVVLFIGRIGTEKNITLLLKSFVVVAKRDKRAKLVLVGSGDDLKDFRKTAYQSGYGDRIIFAGRHDRSKLGAFYEIASVFAFPSLGDTQGLVLAEAALSGTPIVMVDADITEVVKDGVNGYIARKTIKDFAAKILLLLGNDRKRLQMGQAGIKLASRFSASHQGTKLIRCYEQTIKRHAALSQASPSISAENPPD